MANPQGAHQPVEIQRNDRGVMRVLWDDGHESRYVYADLRRACPCATCREQGAVPQNPFQIISTATPSEVEPVHLSAVGHYALNIEWSDGHHAGIYPWDLLRALCPCPQCQSPS